jgi:hypothetical protein
MSNLIDIFESIEQFAYKILIWIILLPKTLAKIIIDPSWAPGYISRELREKEHNRFDEYFPPVILILMVAVVPFVYFSYFAVTPSATISAPDAAYVGEDVILSASADFISDIPPYRFEWKDKFLKPLPVNFSSEDGSVVWIAWDTPGDKHINVVVSNLKGEQLWDYAVVHIGKMDEDLSGFDGIPTLGPTPSVPKADLTEALKKTDTLLLGLLFLGLPLMFALAVDAFREKPLSAESMRRSFYIQCYYFSLPYLFLWAGLVAPQYFLTPSEALTKWAMLGMFFYFLGWLVYQETRLIAVERAWHWLKALGLSIAILLFDIMLILALPSMGEFNSMYPDLLRVWLWILFSATTLALIITSWVHAFRKRKLK